MNDPIVVVGAGHNGLVAACYLAQAGCDVLVLEQHDRPGGGSRTEETIPGYRFDLHSVAHNMINMTGGRSCLGSRMRPGRWPRDRCRPSVTY